MRSQLTTYLVFGWPHFRTLWWNIPCNHGSPLLFQLRSFSNYHSFSWPSMQSYNNRNNHKNEPSMAMEHLNHCASFMVVLLRQRSCRYCNVFWRMKKQIWARRGFCLAFICLTWYSQFGWWQLLYAMTISLVESMLARRDNEWTCNGRDWAHDALCRNSSVETPHQSIYHICIHKRSCGTHLETQQQHIWTETSWTRLSS